MLDQALTELIQEYAGVLEAVAVAAAVKYLIGIDQHPSGAAIA